MSWIGLPFESWYAFLRMLAVSSSMRTAFDEVEPPSRPMTPRTTWPGSNVAASNFGIV